MSDFEVEAAAGTITLKCQGCSKEETFESPAHAFEAGWDCPPYFTGYVTCDTCPISKIWNQMGWQ